MGRLWASTLSTARYVLSRDVDHHVQRASTIRFRSIHSETVEKELKTWKLNQVRQLSIKITNSKDTPDDQFFKSLIALRPMEQEWKETWNVSIGEKPDRFGLVILFTPGFVPWFNDDAFVPKILQQISRTPSASSSFIYDVYYACVDGIAPEEHHGTFHGQPVTEGFSFLHSPSKKALGTTTNIHHNNPSSSTAIRPPSLFFKSNYRNYPRVIVPLANTIFQTGRPSMLVSSRWQAKGGTFIETTKRQEKATASVFAFSGIKKHPFLYIPARPVTPFRTVKSGFGNIIRTLEFGEDDIGPASRELETAVSAISESLGGSTINVWALIVPAGVVGAEKPTMPETDPRYVRFWLDRGASLCRVVSGGGGWGSKQGLLSLDPSVHYPPGTLKAAEDEMSSLENTAQVGASIRFLIVENNQPLPSPKEQVRATSTRKSIVFGTIPSTIDGIPKAYDDTQETKYSYRVGHFGCVSGAGISYHARRWKQISSLEEDGKPELEFTLTEAQDQEDGNQELDDAMNMSRQTDIYGILDAEATTSPDQESTSKDTTAAKQQMIVTKTKIDLPGSYVYMDARERREQRFRLVKVESKKFLPVRIQRFVSRQSGAAFRRPNRDERAQESNPTLPIRFRTLFAPEESASGKISQAEGKVQESERPSRNRSRRKYYVLPKKIQPEGTVEKGES